MLDHQPTDVLQVLEGIWPEDLWNIRDPNGPWRYDVLTVSRLGRVGVRKPGEGYWVILELTEYSPRAGDRLGTELLFPVATDQKHRFYRASVGHRLEVRGVINAFSAFLRQNGLGDECLVASFSRTANLRKKYPLLRLD